jgi:glycosyltransferase involved in cell wall biosynthesis
VRADLAPRVGSIQARADEANAGMGDLRERLGQLERRAEIATMTAWLPHADVPEDLLISVIMPTRDRRALVAEAIASVAAQTYRRWELVVVDDGSTDGTGELLRGLDDSRVRTVRTEGVGECAARNAGLDAARGDVITYLDDDNRFDPQWLKAVAATFNALPGTSVAYGARVCDDHGRVHQQPSSGRPWLLFLPWDEDAVRHFNIADTNVLAHRRGDVRYDESLTYFVDWDLLLRLSQDAVPVEIPAIAVYYRTDVDGRITSSLSRDDMDRQYRIVRERFDRGRSAEPAAP